MEIVSKNIFENGATWLRTDFHLHTIKDNEFQPIANPNDFFNRFIERLKAEEINIGVVTNHNKFDKDEYVNLRKKAFKEHIWILPGVELSVNDGANGIHCLIVFDDEHWIVDGEDYINQFLTSAFEGIANRENENTRCNYSLTDTLEKLNYHCNNGRNSFVIMAHVEQNSGFLKELDGGRIQQFAKNENFRQFVLGFQKFRTYDRLAGLNTWFGNKLPAFVEGSDCKSIETVGKAHVQNGEEMKTYIKIGAFNFDALKYALIDHENRIKDAIHSVYKAWLKSISFNTRKWQGKKLSFNQGMNNFIGIRGSGKSTLLETVRYALDIPLGANAHEPKYKESIVQNFLGSGGKIEVELIDEHQTTYIAERIYEETPSIYQIDSTGKKELQYNLKINHIVNKPLYYGQKDLSEIGEETSTEDLINKLMGDKLMGVKREIEEQGGKIINIISEIKKVDRLLLLEEEIKAKKASIEKDMKVFIDNKINEKLNRQIEFNKDGNRLDSMLEFERDIIEAVQNVFNDYHGSFKSYTSYESKENEALFIQALDSFAKFEQTFLYLAEIVKRLQIERGNLEAIQKTFFHKYEELKEEFAEIKRAVNLPNIEADTYVHLSKDLDLQIAKLNEIKKLRERKMTLHKNFNLALTALKDLWHKEFQLIQEEIDKLNTEQPKDAEGNAAINIVPEFKGNKERFKEFMKAFCRGCGLRDDHYDQIVAYPDLIEVYNDFDVEGSLINRILSGGNNLQNFKSKFLENLNEFLLYRVPDKFSIYYKGRPLHEHSLGQRASALIIFILTLKENDLIIIDQPEDDLDNQTIYTDVITELKKLKTKTQFIFATHNPNIPVLGDCEQLISCSINSNLIKVKTGSIDSREIQQNIVDIMEGGNDAFEKRKTIYELWKR